MSEADLSASNLPIATGVLKVLVTYDAGGGIEDGPGRAAAADIAAYLNDYFAGEAEFATAIAALQADDAVLVVRPYVGLPPNSFGKNGELTFDKDAKVLYGPKANGSWPPTPVSLVGPSAYAGTSTSSNTIGTGSKPFTTQPGLAWAPGLRARIAADATNWIEGQITSYSGTTLVISVDTASGSGTFASWNIGLTGPAGAAGASAYAGTSASSLAIGTGSKPFTTQSGLAYFAGQRLRAAADASNWMDGVVTSYSGTSLVLSIDAVGGTGTFTSWNIGPTGQPGLGGLGSAITVAPDYGNPGGQGDRKTGGIVVVTASSGLVGAGSISNLVDGDTTANTTHGISFTGGVTNGRIILDYGLNARKVIQEVTIAQSSAVSHGTWQAKYTDDLTTLTAIGSSFVWNSTNQVVSAAANQIGARYLVLDQVSGSTNASSFITEITVKIGSTILDGIGTIPTGGASGQVLSKKSGTNFDSVWADAPGDLFARLPSTSIISEWRFNEKTGTTVYDRRSSNNIVFDATFQSTYSAPAPEWTGHGLRLSSSMIQTPSMAGVRTVAIVYRVKRGEAAGFMLSGLSGSSGSGLLASSVVPINGSYWVGSGNGVAPVRFRADNGAAAYRLTRGGYVLVFCEVPSAITMTLGLGGRYGTTSSRCAEYSIVHLAAYGGTLSSQDRIDYYNVMRQALLPRGIYLDWRDCLDYADCVAAWGQSNLSGRALITDLSAGQLATRVAHTFIQPGLASGTVWPRPDLLSIGLNQQLELPATQFGPEVGAMLAREAAGASRMRDLYISKTSLGSTWLAPSTLGVGGLTASNTWYPAELPSGSLLHNAQTAWWDMEQALLLRGVGPRLRALWWMQGEQDATNQTAAASHQTYLQALYDDARNYLGYASVPMILGRIRNLDPTMDATAAANVRAAQSAFAAANSGCVMIDCDSYALKADNVHYTGASQVTFGGALHNNTPF